MQSLTFQPLSHTCLHALPANHTLLSTANMHAEIVFPAPARSGAAAASAGERFGL